MKQKHTYHQYSLSLFEGFYESNLYNSDTEYYLNEYLNGTSDNPKAYEIKDFAGFCRKVSEYAVSLLESDLNVDSDILSDFRLLEIDSPRYYNFRTDRLILSVNVDVDLLQGYAYSSHPIEFESYLKENFTSYDGFISFVPNNLSDFLEWAEQEQDRAIDVLIEFYLLSRIDLDSYHRDLYEKANELQMEFIEPSGNRNNNWGSFYPSWLCKHHLRNK